MSPERFVKGCSERRQDAPCGSEEALMSLPQEILNFEIICPGNSNIGELARAEINNL